MSPVKRTRLVTVYSLSHVQLFCDPMDCNPPGSSVHEISQARILEWVAISSSKGSSPRDQTRVSCGSCIAGGFFTTSTWEALMSYVLLGIYFNKTISDLPSKFRLPLLKTI